MICLGIESTAHTFSCGIVTFNGKILSNQRAVFETKEGGMIPNLVAEHHREKKDEVLKNALKEANISLNEIDLISYVRGPGLAPCLSVGRDFAKALALKLNKPIIGVNHCLAHLAIGELVSGCKDPVYLFVSGVNTQVIAFSNNKFRIFGETLDIGLGNALDKFGRAIGLGFPAGPRIEELAKNGKFIELPYLVKGMDLSFSGIVTHATNLVKQKKAKIEDVCYSFQEVCFSMLAEVTERALAYCDKNELLLIGGVAANKRLNMILSKMCDERGAKFYSVPLELAGDQGAMIAWQGILEFKAGKRFDINNCEIFPYERIDEIVVDWRV